MEHLMHISNLVNVFKMMHNLEINLYIAQPVISIPPAGVKKGARQRQQFKITTSYPDIFNGERYI
jgi:hypothetical protein